MVVLIAMSAFLLGGYVTNFWNENVKIDKLARINSVTYLSTGSQKVKGKVVMLDLEPLTRGGAAEMTVQTNHGEKHEIRIMSGESACDREAITLPADLSKGTVVEVKGIVGSSNALVVCEKGTHIKNL